MDSAPSLLPPPPYLDALLQYFKVEEAETWQWFQSTQAQADYADALRLDLLKQTYRLDAAAYPDLFVAVEEAKRRLGLDVPVTLYQSQQNRGLNASLFFVPGEAHIVLQGDVLRLLNPAELRWVLGHELAHYLLWNQADGGYFVSDRIVQAMACEARAEPSHGESARLARLYTEIFADRGALLVCGDPTAVISGLVKMQTGLAQVDAASYVKQADEIFARAKVRTEELSHPEAFIRARAVMLWADGSDKIEAEVTRMLEGSVALDRLDLVAQQRLTGVTRTWLEALLEPDWFHTDAIRGHARMFFPDFEFRTGANARAAVQLALEDSSLSIRDYFCYLLVDFASVDPELELEPLREAFRMAAPLGWATRLEALAVKELKLKKRDVQQIRHEVAPKAPTGEPEEAKP